MSISDIIIVIPLLKAIVSNTAEINPSVHEEKKKEKLNFSSLQTKSRLASLWASEIADDLLEHSGMLLIR